MNGPRIVCFACQKPLTAAEIAVAAFCEDCINHLDPEGRQDREFKHAVAGLKGAEDHITNSAGNCVSWCPQCRTLGKSAATTTGEQK